MNIWPAIKIKLYGLLILSIFSLLFFFIIYGPLMTQFISIIKWGDIIEFSNVTLMCVCGLPVVGSFIILSILVIFKKGITPLNVSKPFDTLLVLITIISLGSGFVSSGIFLITISISPYTECHFKNIKSTKYYVKDPKLCKTIDYKAFWRR